MERWKTIEIAPKYEVSNKGLIRNKDTKLTLKQRITKGQSPKVTLSNKGKPITLYVHRLVAQAFAKGFTNNHIVIHKNGDASDNRVKNLKVASHSEMFSESSRHLISIRMKGNNNALKRRG